MKSMIIVLCSILIILFCVHTAALYSHDRSRLRNLLRQSMGNNDDVIWSKGRIPLHTSSVPTTSVKPQSSSVEQDEEINDEKRDALDSGEEQYFRWASLNRRPMESLFGRKRSPKVVLSDLRATRLGGGIWRSGLVD